MGARPRNADINDQKEEFWAVIERYQQQDGGEKAWVPYKYRVEGRRVAGYRNVMVRNPDNPASIRYKWILLDMLAWRFRRVWHIYDYKSGILVAKSPCMEDAISDYGNRLEFEERLGLHPKFEPDKLITKLMYAPDKNTLPELESAIARRLLKSSEEQAKAKRDLRKMKKRIMAESISNTSLNPHEQREV